MIESAKQFPHNCEHRAEKDCLMPEDIDALLEAAASNRHGRRDRALLLTMHLHGLLVSEVCALRLDDLDRTRGRLTIRRRKGGRSGIHPVSPEEMSVLDAHLAVRSRPGPWLFMNERGGPLTRQAVHYLVRSAGRKAGIPFEATPQQLRRSCGCFLAGEGLSADEIRDHMGHRTVAPSMCYLHVTVDHPVRRLPRS